LARQTKSNRLAKKCGITTDPTVYSAEAMTTIDTFVSTIVGTGISTAAESTVEINSYNRCEPSMKEISHRPSTLLTYNVRDPQTIVPTELGEIKYVYLYPKQVMVQLRSLFFH
jgi:hypothetical protein